ncbi:MAG: cation diffusion facilitator family transporter [Erysipelotrichaceae bacterium]
MVTFIIHRFINNYKNYQDAHVREQYGKVTSIIGIFFNVSLSLAKFMVGTLAGSVSITADAVNNLSDAGNSIISLVSFKLSSMPADEEHPFGHERFEYIASLIVAFLILFVGIDLMRSSLGKILHPDAISFSYVSLIVLVMSIFVKFYMYRYNKHFGEEINSSMMKATAADSISDVLATSSVLLALVLSPIFHFQLDGYMGAIVAVLILKTGYDIIKSTLDELLGMAPPIEMVKMIEDKIMSYDGVLGFHDLVIHSYGPNRSFASVHVEVSSKENVLISHDVIDNIEKDFAKDDNLQLVIHLDPVVTDDETTNEMKSYIRNTLNELDEKLCFHDFRMVPGGTHTNIIFDVVMPSKYKYSDHYIVAYINEALSKKDHKYFAVITFDHAYVKQVDK